MPQVDVKITDLEIYDKPQTKDTDLFLLASCVDSFSRSFISKTTDISSIANLLTNKPREVSGTWTFESDIEPPLDLTRFDPRNFFSKYIISSESVRNGVINISGNYDNNTFFPPEYDPKIQYDAINQSMYAIANLDYVNKIVALAHKDLLNLFINIPETIYKDDDSSVVPSFVGDILFTTHNFPNEDALRSIFGDGSILISDLGNSGIEIRKPNTRWVKHTGDFVFRCTDNQSKVKKSTTTHTYNADDNSNNNNRSIPLGTHAHGIDSYHNHSVSFNGSIDGNTQLYFEINGIGTKLDDHPLEGKGSRSHEASISLKDTISMSLSKDSGGSTVTETNNSGGNEKVNILQAFKRVYVWERVQ